MTQAHKNQNAPARSSNSGEGKGTVLAARPTEDSTPAFDAAMAELDVINTAYIAGYDVGYSHGRNDRRTEAEAVTLHEAAAEVVLRMATFPERDPEVDRAAAQRRADNFGQPIMKAGAA